MVLALLGASEAWGGANYGTGNFPFPQNRDNPYGFHSSIYNNADVLAAFNQWTKDCVTSTGAGGFLRVQRPNEPGLLSDSTVSEGIGYGMVIAVYMNDENLFDNLWKYEQIHLDGNGLMNWYIDSSGGTQGSNGATDADEDMAWALLMASRQWGGSGTLSNTYWNYAVTQMNAIYVHELNGGIPDGGDSFSAINPSYFAPAYYREFANATGQTGWLSVAGNCYSVLNANLAQGYGNANNGLDSAWCTSAGVSTNTNNPPYDYQYDACRTPFRITEDYLWFGTSQAQSYSTKTSNFFSGIGAVSIVDGYHLDGTPDAQSPSLPVSQSPVSQSAAFVGPAGVGAMVNRNYQQYMDDTYSNLAGSRLLQGGTYYDESWTVMSLLMLSDNFLDYNLYVTPTPTPVVTFPAYSPVTFRVNCADTAFTDGLGQIWAADQAYNGSWGYDPATTGSTAAHAGVSIIGATNNQAQLYRNERYNNPQYFFTTANGYYQVTLLFAENYYTSAGQRIFNVLANGTPVITNLDVFAASGGTDHAYPVTLNNLLISNGGLTLTWQGVVADGKVNAIQVIRQSVTPTPTSTPTATVPWTVTPTNTPKPGTFTPMPTSTPSSTPTLTATPSSTATGTFTATNTRTSTDTTTFTSTATSSNTPTRTFTGTSTPMPTVTPTATGTPSLTASFTASPTSISAFTPTSTNTFTASFTATNTPTLTHSPTPTATPTETSASTAIMTSTMTSSFTSTLSFTPTGTLTFTFSRTFTPTETFSPTVTSSPIPSFTGTLSPTATPTNTLTYTKTYTPTFTPTQTATSTTTASMTSTTAMTSTDSPTETATVTSTPTPGLSPTTIGSPGISLGLPYPNPVLPGGTVNLWISAVGLVEVHWSVFTTAFRRIRDGVFSLGGPAFLLWDLKDGSGSPVAAGLYYLRVEIKGGSGTTSKILKIIVRP